MAAALGKIAKAIPVIAKPRFALFIKYAKVELTPPSPREFGEIKTRLGNVISAYRSGRWKTLTVKEAWINTLVGAEILMWFYFGEIIGKRNIIGYDINLA